MAGLCHSRHEWSCLGTQKSPIDSKSTGFVFVDMKPRMPLPPHHHAAQQGNTHEGGGGGATAKLEVRDMLGRTHSPLGLVLFNFIPGDAINESGKAKTHRLAVTK